VNAPVRVHAYFQHMPPYSGAASLRGASIMTAVAALLADRPNCVHVYTTIPCPDALPGLTVESLDAPEVENKLSLVARIWGELRVGWAAGRKMFAANTLCNLAVISTPGYLAALVICALARRRGIPYVLELRDIYPQVYAEAGLIGERSWLYGFFVRRSRIMYERACAVVAATKGLAREVSAVSPRARVRHVYNGFPAELLNRGNNKHTRFTVCFHGTFGFFQDVETLLVVGRLLVEHDIEMVVVGYGRKEGEILRAAHPNLKFYGRQSFERTVSIIEMCHVGLCLRRDEGISKDAFPVKVWEYLGLGMPSIVTPPCEAGEFLEANRCGFQLPSGAARKIVDVILQLQRRPSDLEEMARRCRMTAQQYTREKTGMDAAQVVLSCLSENRSQSRR
jgi:glycosyltransferase involved in cell wall biosynthesis